MKLVRFVILVCAVAGAVSIPVGGAVAQTTGLELAHASNCMACHQIEKKRVGPAFSAVAERFAGNAEAADYLADSILNGSRGHWGAVPMPKQSQVSPDNARALAQWILSLSNSATQSE